MYFLGKRKVFSKLNLIEDENEIDALKKDKRLGFEKIDHAGFFTKGIGLIILTYLIIKVSHNKNPQSLDFITPNFINLLLIGLCIFFHRNIVQFLSAIDKAIGGAAGILIQFPLYFGIMGVMKSSGLVQQLSEFFVSISDGTSFPILTLISAGIVNIFVPSGGGQWAIQGPIIVQAAEALDVSLAKSIMALAYGDQLTNMLQPFWALPLLGITKLKAKDILPYTIILMLAGGAIYLSILLIF